MTAENKAKIEKLFEDMPPYDPEELKVMKFSNDQILEAIRKLHGIDHDQQSFAE